MKILFADDDIKYALVLKRFLEAEGFEVVYAGNGNIALELYRETHPDLVLLDVNMPEKNGFEVAQQIRSNDTKTLIFFLTDRAEINDKLHGFELKANDYLTKPFYPEELIARINERFERIETANKTQVYRFGQTTFDYAASELYTNSERQLLTPRQADVLKALACSINKPVERETILTTIWGTDSYANSLALNVQIALIRKALKTDSSIEIKTIPKKGYVLREIATTP